MAEEAGRRLVKIANPWRGQADDVTNSLAALHVHASGPEAHEGSHRLGDVLVFDWREFCGLFATIHVNWDPAAFAQRQSLHMCVSRSRAWADGQCMASRCATDVISR